MVRSPEVIIRRRVEGAVDAALRGPCRIVAQGPDGERITPVLAAVSGGPDSLAMLHALARAAARSGRPVPPPIHVIYVDHGLRPASVIAAERAVVAGQAAALGLPFTVCVADVRGSSARGRRSPEDAARRARYAALGEAACTLGVDAVAVGHTASDQAETVLLRLIRGTGIAGLAGMEWRASWPLGGPGPELVRPLLGITREDTEAYCRALGLTPCRDTENASPRYLRNRVRHEILPLLARANPRIVEALGHVAASAREARAFVEDVLDARWREIARVDAGGVSLARAATRALPPAVRTAALRRAAALASGEGLPPERVHLAAMASLLDGPGGRTVELPGGIIVEARGGELCIRRAGRAPSPPPLAGGEWTLTPNGELTLPGWTVRSKPVARARTPAGDPLTAWLRPEIFDGSVSVTGRRPGDRIAPLGMVGEKKVQDLLVDARVPRAERDAVPVVRAGGRVAWVVGVRIAGWAAARADGPAVRVTFRRDGPGDLLTPP
jgi:tRNA(Ile)-lysidine synthetase-like protein